MPRDRYDDDDDRPRRRRDDDDDRPRRSRRRRDDDDDFDRPPPRKAGGGIKTVLIVLGVVGVVVFAVCGGLLFFLWPRFEQIGTTGARIQSQNNLKMAGLSAHNFHDSTGSMPRPFLDTDELGQKVEPPSDPANRLSWRVSLLPYTFDDGPAVYRRFNIREGWNSPTNAPLKDTPVKAYRHPLDAKEKGEPVTRIRCFYDNGAAFDAKPHARTPLVAMSDGTSNTLMFVESADAVTWTAFNDFRYSPTAPLPQFGHPKIKGGFNAVLADGSVRFITDKVQERTLRQLITRADGEIITDPNW